MPAVFRASFATAQTRRLSDKTAGNMSRRRIKRQAPSLSQHEPWLRTSAVHESLLETRLALLKFRKDTDTIGRDLRVSPDGLRSWIEGFLRLGRFKLVEDRDSGEVARNLHNLSRKFRSDSDKDSEKLVNEMVETVRKAYVAGLIPSAPLFSMHLFAYYKESGHFNQGLDFWNWVSKADDAPLAPVFVGPAIEMLAVYGAGIQYCEDIYQRTLDQQNDISSQYHLSPGAILPDRSKPANIKGASLLLLQGILTARVLYGKWQSSYLTLDTSFRLLPTQMVPRILALFVYERPIFEVLPVFYMYCRGGNVVPGQTFMALLKSMKALADHISTYTFKIKIIEAIVSMLEAYVASGGVLSTSHLNMIARALVSALPQNHTIRSKNPVTLKVEDMTRLIVGVLTNIIQYFSLSNARPNRVTFDGIISQVLLQGYPNLAKVALQDMRELNLSPEKPAALDLLRGAYLLRDSAMLKTTWACLCNLASSEQEQVLDTRSWTIMATAAKACGDDEFFQEQLQDLAPRLPSGAKTAADLADRSIFNTRFSAGQGLEGPSVDEVRAFQCFCETVQLSFERMERVQPGKYRDLTNNPVDEKTIFDWPDTGEESWQRSLYEELTHDGNQKSSRPSQVEQGHDPQHLAHAVSDTGIRFDELRYSNWKTINKLLIQTEVSEGHRKTSTDAAMQEKRASPQHRSTKSDKRPDRGRSTATAQQFQQYQQDAETERARQMTEQEWRQRILRLRNPDYELLVHTRPLSAP
ncbi:MAG: hypothetical protein LQ350_007383 [Teloschistes chrysophthalmus]|nr:MAG: hypothetical protein LQ350_007383 [Niorma chrysophthalma]